MKNSLFLVIFLLFFTISSSSESLDKSVQISPNHHNLSSNFLSHSSSEVTTTSYKSWSEKFIESIYLCILGILFFICAFPALWFNERRAVKTSEIINEGFRICEELSPFEIKPENNGKLVFLSGFATNSSIIKDEEIGVFLTKVLKLRRKVEMFQWKQSVESIKRRNDFGGGETTHKTYSFTKVWEDNPINSGFFKENGHENNQKWIIKNETFITKTCNIGSFELNEFQLNQLKNEKSLVLEEKNKEGFSEVFLEKIKGISSLEKVKISGNFIYIRTEGDNKEDMIGDLRISFDYVPEEEISLVSCQNNQGFIPYDLKKKGLKYREETQAFIEKNEKIQEFSDEEQQNCCVCCGFVENLCKTPNFIDWIYEKSFTKKEIFEEKDKENTVMTWVYRFIGFFMMVFGIYLFFSPVYEFLEVLPILSSVGRLVVFVFALLVSVPICSLIVFFSWLFYRPVVALGFLGVVVVFAVTLAVILAKSGESGQTTT